MAEIKEICSTDVRGRKVSAVALEVQSKLGELAGDGYLKDRIWRARTRLIRVHQRWTQPAAAGRIKRFLYLEQKPQYEEVADVRAAYLRFIPEKAEANHADTIRLAEELRGLIEIYRHTDADFYQPAIEALEQAIRQGGSLLRAQGVDHREDKSEAE